MYPMLKTLPAAVLLLGLTACDDNRSGGHANSTAATPSPQGGGMNATATQGQNSMERQGTQDANSAPAGRTPSAQ